MTTKTKTVPKIYRIAPNRRILVFSYAGLMVILAIYLSALLRGIGTLAIVIPSPLLLIAAFFLYMVYYTRLKVSPEGIEYFQLGYRLKTTWENIERIGMVPTGMQTAEGLILRESALQGKALGRKNLERNRLDRAIPLTFFQPRWREGGLGEEIKRFAPHLF